MVAFFLLKQNSKNLQKKLKTQQKILNSQQLIANHFVYRQIKTAIWRIEKEYQSNDQSRKTK